MNWRRGLFRLWLVGAALFVIFVASVSYNEIKANFDAWAIAATSRPEAVTPSFLMEFRRQYPEYNGLSDAQIADAAYNRFYNDMTREQFEKKLAEKMGASKTKIVKFQDQLHEFPADFTDEEIVTALRSTIKNPWASVSGAAAIAFGIPLIVLILGASLVWAFSGFAVNNPRPSRTS
jgi:hypothetical protein